jgi:LAS superfamily LD-carboxypeptidase LdcB
MKRFRVQIFIAIVAIGALSGILLFSAGARRKSHNPSDRAFVENASSPVGAAAARNAQLRTELKWLFGGKPQRGWYLYTALISRLLDTKRDPGSDEFASALARWQKKAGLPPSGVLDDTSFYKIIAEWQNRRLKDRTPAQPQQLITAPSSDFYDPQRLDELRQVERETYDAYKRMVRAAISEKSLGLAHVTKKELAPSEKYLKIISSYRSREYQQKLRRESPNAGSAGLAINSPHFTGRALDLYVGGEPVETNDPNRAIQVQTRVYQWLVKNAGRYGFQPYFYEPWHWEYVGTK